MLDYAGSWPGAYLLRRGLFLPRELPRLLDPGLVREGLAALDPLARLAATLTPDPGPAAAKVCALESANYMRNQLLRDADWAGMAHSLEIRVPLVDFTLAEDAGAADRRACARRGQGCACVRAFPALAGGGDRPGQDWLRRADGGLDGLGGVRPAAGARWGRAAWGPWLADGRG